MTLPAPFRLKGHDALDWRKAVTESLSTEGNLVCHAGFAGKQGPLPLVFGKDNVFVSPPKSPFPLLGLEKARVV